MVQNRFTKPLDTFEMRCTEVLRGWTEKELKSKNALRILALMLKEAVQSGSITNRGSVEYTLGWLLVGKGHYEKSLEHFQAARTLYAQAGHRERLVLCELAIGEAARNSGDAKLAVAACQRAAQVGQSLNNATFQVIAMVHEAGLVARARGEQEAQPLFESAIALGQNLPTTTRLRNDYELRQTYIALAHKAAQGKATKIDWQRARRIYFETLVLR